MHGVEDRALVGELDLGLGRVYVHVHSSGVDGEVDHTAGEPACQQRALVGLLYGGLQQGALYVAAVDEEVLQAAAAAARAGRAGEAADAHGVALQAGGDGKHAQRGVAAQQGVYRALRSAVAGGEELLPAVPYAADGDVRTPQRAAQGSLQAGRALGLVALEELAPGGRVVKQPAHGYAGALRRAGGAHLLYVPGLEAHIRALGRAALTGGELYVRNAGDSRQRLAAEAQRADGLQAALVGKLAGGVAQEGHPGVLGRHAAAVVRDADELRAAAGELHRYVARPRVDGVFNELLHRRGGPLHDLARGYEVSHVRG